MWLLSTFWIFYVAAAEPVPVEDIYNPGYEQFKREIKNDASLNETYEYAPPVFGFFTDSLTPDAEYEFENVSQILMNRNFDNNKKTVIYIHGFLGSMFCKSVKHIVEAYQQINDHNILVLDWHYYAQPEYFFNAVPNTFKIGKRAASAILDMLENNLSLERLHIVGHSLGGQMAGVIGQMVQEQTNGRVILKRISALDPASPGFYGDDTKTHISEDDAEFVDVIHTDARVFGAPVSTGTVDFWPNGAMLKQPGCYTDLCSHSRSWLYWADSITDNSKKQFNAVTSKLGWPGFIIGITGKFNPKVVMGINCPFGLSGNYYLQTNHQSPYARGRAGVQYKWRWED